MFQSLQICRALAALLVVLFHLAGAIGSEKYFNLPGLQQAFIFGHSGVAFFFVLSGFIIAHVHADDVGVAGRLPAYAYKRMVRIYPSFLLVFCLVFAVAYLSDSLKSTLPTNVSVLAKAMMLLPQEPKFVGDTGAPVLTVAWSLHYEVFFYAVFGLAIVSRVAAIAAITALVAHGAACWLGPSCSFPRSFFASHWIVLFAIWATLAWAVNNLRPVPWPRWVLFVGAFGFAAIAAADVAGMFSTDATLYLAYGVASGLIVLGSVTADRRDQREGNSTRTCKTHCARRSSVTEALGNSSYALYLLHYPLISAICKLAIACGLIGQAGAFTTFFVGLLVCLLTAHLFHSHFEKGLLKSLRRHQGAAT